ncbi:MAG: hypothetical protein AAGJ46_19800 [Planctomycetota bacterium]
MATTLSAKDRAAARASPSTRGQATPNRPGVTAASWPCLITSADAELAQWAGSAAQAAGWSVVSCSSARESLREAVLHEFPLALLDYGGDPSHREALADLLRMLKSSTGSVQVVCERRPDDGCSGERWARQSGAWLYLPDVNASSDLTGVCREARSVVEKLRGPASPSATRA